MTADDHLLVGAYAVGALDRHETVEFETHLAGCEVCRAEVAELTETAAQLAVAVPASVSEPLLDRVMQQVRATPQLPPLHAPPGRINGNADPRLGRLPSPAEVKPPALFADSGSVTPLRPRPSRPVRAVLGVAAAIALVLVTGTMATRVIGEQAREREVAAVIDDPASRHVALRVVPGGPAAGSVDVHLQPDTGQAVVDARSLGALDPDKTYELWFMAGDGPRRAATFDPDDAGTARMRFDAPLTDPTGFGVTVEPAGGSDAPTTSLIFQGEA